MNQSPESAARRGIVVAAQRAVTAAMDLVLQAAKSSATSLSTQEEHDAIVQALVHNVIHVGQWASWSGTSLQSNSVARGRFIELDVVDRDHPTSLASHSSTSPGIDVLRKTQGHIAILGGPGTGKTTLLKQIATSLLAASASQPVQLPILLQARELAHIGLTDRPLTRVLRTMLTLLSDDSLASFEPKDTSSGLDDSRFLVLLDSLNLAILLDGLDELSTDQVRGAVIQELSNLSQCLTRSRIVLTCRTADFPTELKNFHSVEIAPLSRDQQLKFAQQALGDRYRAQAFVTQVSRTPYSGATTHPLVLSLLSALYARTGSLPAKPKTLYRKLVSTLLEDWDAERSIKRESRFSRFGPEIKFEFLSHLAYSMTIRGLASVDADELSSLIREIAHQFDLPPNESLSIISEIESYTGLILQSGERIYSFIHKSIQEYLCADHIARLPSIHFLSRNLHLLPAELAIASAISSNPSGFIVELVLVYLLQDDQFSHYVRTFASRLIIERPDFVQSDELLLTILLLAVKGDFPELLVVLPHPYSVVDATRVAEEYYSLMPADDPRFLVIRTQHNRFKLPSMMQIGDHMSQAIERAVKPGLHGDA